MKQIKLGDAFIGLHQPLTLIAGPCVIENEKITLETAEFICKTVRDLPVQLVFKASYKKANRTSIDSFTGLASANALQILANVKREFGIPVLTDIHTELEAPVVAEVVDILQIPAFLSRQTDLFVAAARTGKIINIKKGQFLAPEDMQKALEKILSVENHNIMLTERGTSFGYHNLVVDMRSLVIMARSGYPVIYDATHSIQIPAGEGEMSGGQPEFILPLARAALATGAVSGIFMEVHPDPTKALSDARSQLALEKFPEVLSQLLTIYSAVQQLN